MAPRSLWNGTITVGAIVVPVKLYTATESKTVSFQQVHLADGARIRHKRFCSAEDREVPYAEVAKGYEVAPGEFVLVDKEELAAAAGSRAHVVALEEFAPTADIDPVYFDKTYYLGPGKDGEDAYRLLHDALDGSGRAGLGRFTFHNHEYVAIVRAADGTLLLHTLRFADEVVAPEELDVPAAGQAPGDREVEMAGRLVDMLHQDFDPGAYEDEHRAQVLALIDRKASGEAIEAAAAAPPQDTSDDLLAVLEASLSATKAR